MLARDVDAPVLRRSLAHMCGVEEVAEHGEGCRGGGVATLARNVVDAPVLRRSLAHVCGVEEVAEHGEGCRGGAVGRGVV